MPDAISGARSRRTLVPMKGCALLVLFIALTLLAGALICAPSLASLVEQTTWSIR